MTNELEKARQARQRLGRVRQKLLSPSVGSLDRSTADLAVAIECLEQVEKGFRTGQPRPPGWRHALRLEIAGLRRELREVDELLTGAGRFYEGWGRLVTSRTEEGPANYTAFGKTNPVIPICADRVVMHG